jgi:hypothetical protein
MENNFVSDADFVKAVLQHHEIQSEGFNPIENKDDFEFLKTKINAETQNIKTPLNTWLAVCEVGNGQKMYSRVYCKNTDQANAWGERMAVVRLAIQV